MWSTVADSRGTVEAAAYPLRLRIRVRFLFQTKNNNYGYIKIAALYDCERLKAGFM